MYLTSLFVRMLATLSRAVLAASILSLAVSAPAVAQPAAAPADPNPGALTFAGSVDAPTVYYFRGIRQETDPMMTLWPAADLGLSLFSGEGAVKSVGVNIGVWNSLHTGSSGGSGNSGRLHYEEDFYSTLALGFGGGVSVGATFTAYTSPNSAFNTVKEISLKVSKSHQISPYGLVAFELNGQADGGAHEGVYLEFGAGPTVPLRGGVTLGIPVKVGLSLSNYYEGTNPHHQALTEDSRFGFFDLGGILTVPLKGIPGRFGAWNVHGGADVIVLGHHPELLNVNTRGETSKTAVVGLLGIGLSY